MRLTPFHAVKEDGVIDLEDVTSNDHRDYLTRLSPDLSQDLSEAAELVLAKAVRQAACLVSKKNHDCRQRFKTVVTKPSRSGVLIYDSLGRGEGGKGGDTPHPLEFISSLGPNSVIAALSYKGSAIV